MPANLLYVDSADFDGSPESLAPPTPAALCLSAAFTSSLVVVAVWTLLSLPVPVGIGMEALVVAACSRRCGIGTAAVIGLLGWMFATGFVVNSVGELRITRSGDYWRLAFLVAVAVLSAALSRPTPASQAHAEAEDQRVGTSSARPATSRLTAPTAARPA